MFAQRDKLADAIDAGKVLPPAKGMDQMRAVVTNSTVDGVLSALFAILIVVVIVDALRIWVKAIKAGGLPTTEVPFVESHLRAPAVDHVRRVHPGEPVPSRRVFGRRRQDARESRPQARCC